MGVFQTAADKLRQSEFVRALRSRPDFSHQGIRESLTPLRESSSAPAMVSIREDAASWGNPRVDKVNGIIHGAKLLGRVSKNGREYSDAALDDAARLYEGSVINLDHPGDRNGGAGRGFMEGIAVAKNVKRQRDGNYGDLHVILTHPAAAALLEWADRFPGKFGMSHNAEGHEVSKGGKRIVESIERVISIDVVRNPATAGGLFESIGDASLAADRVAYPTSRAAFIEAVTGRRSPLSESDGMADEMPDGSKEPDVQELLGIEVTKLNSHEIAKEFDKAAIAVLQSYDTIEFKVSKIRKLLQAKEKAVSDYNKLLGKDKEEPAE